MTVGVLRETEQRCDDALELKREVNVRGAVERDEDVVPRLHAGALPGPTAHRRVFEATQRVDHRVTNKMDPRRVDPLSLEVGGRLGAVGEEQRRQAVGEDAVDLLRHGPIKRPQSRLHVRDRDAELCGRQGDRQGRVDIAACAHKVRSPFEQHLLERDESATCL